MLILPDSNKNTKTLYLLILPKQSNTTESVSPTSDSGTDSDSDALSFATKPSETFDFDLKIPQLLIVPVNSVVPSEKVGYKVTDMPDGSNDAPNNTEVHNNNDSDASPTFAQVSNNTNDQPPNELPEKSANQSQPYSPDDITDDDLEHTYTKTNGREEYKDGQPVVVHVDGTYKAGSISRRRDGKTYEVMLEEGEGDDFFIDVSVENIRQRNNDGSTSSDNNRPSQSNKPPNSKIDSFYEKSLSDLSYLLGIKPIDRSSDLTITTFDKFNKTHINSNQYNEVLYVLYSFIYIFNLQTSLKKFNTLVAELNKRTNNDTLVNLYADTASEILKSLNFRNKNLTDFAIRKLSSVALNKEYTHDRITIMHHLKTMANIMFSYLVVGTDDVPVTLFKTDKTKSVYNSYNEYATGAPLI